MLGSLGSGVSLLDIVKTLQLCLDNIILNLLEQERSLADGVTLSHERHRAEVIPAEFFEIQHTQNLSRREGHKGLDGDGDIGGNLQSDIKDCLHALGIGLNHLPRLSISKILITDTCEVHRILQRLAEAVVLDI